MDVSLEKLIEMKVLRKSIFDTDGTWYIIYTEDGPKDVMLDKLIAE